jgi:allophanate hydrolase subunit 1
MAKEVDETFQRDAKAAIAAIEATRIQTVDEELLSAVENVLRYYDPEREDVAKSLINKLRAAYAKSRAGVTGG